MVGTVGCASPVAASARLGGSGGSLERINEHAWPRTSIPSWSRPDPGRVGVQPARRLAQGRHGPDAAHARAPRLDLGVANAYDADENVRGGTAYLRQLLDRFGGDSSWRSPAYNAGPGAVERYRGIPPYRETRDYVRRVLALYGRTPATTAHAARPPAQRSASRRRSPSVAAGGARVASRIVPRRPSPRGGRRRRRMPIARTVRIDVAGRLGRPAPTARAC